MKASTQRMVLALAALLAVAACSSDGGGPGTGGAGGAAGAGGEPGAGGEAGTGGVAGDGGAVGLGGHGGGGGEVPTLRDALPAIADDAIRRANAIPSGARADAQAGVFAFLRETCSRASPAPPVCLADLVNEADVAEDAGDIAFAEAAHEIRDPKAAMLELKKRALEAPDPSLLEALRAALREAYDNRRVSYSVNVTEAFGAPFHRTYTIYTADETHTLIDPDPAARIDAAESDLSLLDEPYTPFP